MSEETKSIREKYGAVEVSKQDFCEYANSIYTVELSKSWDGNKSDKELLVWVYEAITNAWDKKLRDLYLQTKITDVNTACMCIALCNAVFIRYKLRCAIISHNSDDPNAFVCVDSTEKYKVFFTTDLKDSGLSKLTGIELKNTLKKSYSNIQQAGIRFVLKEAKLVILDVELNRGETCVKKMSLKNDDNNNESGEQKNIPKSIKEGLTALVLDKDELLLRTPPKETPCAVCQKLTTKRCSRCQHLYICSKTCFKKIWKEHRKECAYLQAGRARVQKEEDAKGDKWGAHWYSEATRKVLNPEIHTRTEIYKNHTDQAFVKEILRKRVELYQWLQGIVPQYNFSTDFKMDNQINTYEDFERLLLQCYMNTKTTLYCLTFDLRKEWCRVKANEHAMRGDNQFREQLPTMHMGYYIVLFDSYCYGSMLTTMQKMQASILSVFKSLGEPTVCSRCFEFCESLNIICSNCCIRACNKCVIKRRDGKQVMSCWDCGESVHILDTPAHKFDGKVQENEHRIRDMLLISGLENEFPFDFRDSMPLLIQTFRIKFGLTNERFKELESEAKSMLMSSKVDMHVKRLKQTPWVIQFEKSLERAAKKTGFDRSKINK